MKQNRTIRDIYIFVNGVFVERMYTNNLFSAFGLAQGLEIRELSINLAKDGKLYVEGRRT